MPPFFFEGMFSWLVSSFSSPLSALTGFSFVIKRLIAFALFAVALGPSAFAQDYTATTKWSISGVYTYYPDPGGAATACVNRAGTSSTGTLITNDPSGYYKCKLHNNTTGADVITGYELVSTSCPYGGTLVVSPTGGSSKVGSTYKCVGGTPPPPACVATDNVSNRDITIGWATGASVGSAATYLYKANTDTDFMKAEWCIDSCIQRVKSVAGLDGYQEQSPSPNGYFKIYVPNVPMTQEGGGHCTVGPKGVGTAPDPASASTEPTVPNTFNGKCPTGSVPGGQSPDGMTICIGTATQPPSTSTTSTTTPTTSTTDSNGNTVTTSSTTNTNADGSHTTVTTTTTTAPDGTKTTSTASTTTASTTGAPGTTDKPDQQKDMCALHPELTVCRNSQVQGSCALVTCDGDAIQCATLRAAATIQCQQQKDLEELTADSSTGLGKSIISGADPRSAEIAAMVKGDTVDLSSANLDQSGWLGGGTCLAPITLQVMGSSFTASFDSVCQSIQPIRAAVLLMAFIIAYLLVSRAVLQS